MTKSNPSLILGNKWQVLAPALPFPGLSNAKFQADMPTSIWVGDVDGDGCAEILCPCSVPGGHNFLCTTSYLNPASLTELWKQQGNWGEMIQMDTRVDVIGDWPIQPGDNYVLADVDNDGADEILVFSQSTFFFPCWIGLYKWVLAGDGAKKRLSLNLLFRSIGPLTGGNGASWTLSQLDVFFPADVDGDGAQEIVVSRPGAIGVLKWSDSSLTVLWSGSSIPGNQGTPAWNCGSMDGLLAAAIQGTDHIFAFDNSSSAGLFAWNSPQLEVVWQQSGSFPAGAGPAWPLAPNDVFLCADINGDGNAEIVAYANGSLGVFAWQGSSFASIGVSDKLFNGAGSQPVPPSAAIFLVPNPIADPQIAFQDESAAVTLVAWGGTQFDVVYRLSGFVAGVAEWSLNSADQLYFDDFDGDGWSELFLYNPNSLQVAIVKAEAVQWSVQGTMAAWDMNFILAAPATPFPSYTGSQLEIYQYISNSIDTNMNVSSGGDIRSEYNNTIYKGDFMSMSTYVGDLANSGYDASDWALIQQTLVAELSCVDPVQNMFANYATLAGYIQNQQDLDMATCSNNVTPQPQSLVEYWLGQVLVAVCWGAAAAVPEGGVALSIVASLLGSYFSLPAVASASDLQTQIDQSY